MLKKGDSQNHGFAHIGFILWQNHCFSRILIRIWNLGGCFQCFVCWIYNWKWTLDQPINKTKLTKLCSHVKNSFKDLKSWRCGPFSVWHRLLAPNMQRVHLCMSYQCLWPFFAYRRKYFLGFSAGLDKVWYVHSYSEVLEPKHRSSTVCTNWFHFTNPLSIFKAFVCIIDIAVNRKWMVFTYLLQSLRELWYRHAARGTASRVQQEQVEGLATSHNVAPLFNAYFDCS